MSATSAEITRVYRDLQVKAALVTEKERAVQTRRAALTELKQQVDMAQYECQQRQQPLAAELARLNAAKDECAAAKAERDRAARSQQMRLANLRDEDAHLQRSTQRMYDEIHQAVERVNLARQDASQSDDIDAAVATLQQKAQSEEETLRAFEARVQQVHSACQQRRGAAQLPQIALPLDPATLPLAISSAPAAHVITQQPAVDLPAGETFVFFDGDDS
jgi:myosin heavy subunit